MIQIPIAALKKARTLLGRVRFAQCKLPALNCIRARIDITGVTLAVSDLDQWLETRVDLSAAPTGPDEFLIPAAALSAAVNADKGTDVRFYPKGPKKHRELKLVATCGGLQVETVFPSCDASEFPERPIIDGPGTRLPATTLAALKAVAPCASNSEKRQILNGVFFTPDQDQDNETEAGGMVIATDGKRLAGAPATVPERDFILSNPAVKVLSHPAFLQGEVTVTLPMDSERHLVEFAAGDQVLISKTIEGRYPNFRQVIPNEAAPCTMAIPDPQRTAIAKWLRSEKGRAESVRLCVDKPGRLTLTQEDAHGRTIALIAVPVDLNGKAPVITFSPKYLADALEIGGELHLSDERSPGMTRTPEGRFCVVMPMRTRVPAQSAA